MNEDVECSWMRFGSSSRKTARILRDLTATKPAYLATGEVQRLFIMQLPL